MSRIHISDAGKKLPGIVACCGPKGLYQTHVEVVFSTQCDIFFINFHKSAPNAQDHRKNKEKAFFINKIMGITTACCHAGISAAFKPVAIKKAGWVDLQRDKR